ncbi:hypothetical protein [Ligilactobacillus apodemi]|uniref:hypothetical protein n=1 Tax=Ligilactobacillus apodemi TaxID=307126 RepID=UPI001F1979DB|nr:hypothetical protein [Ligilactobacillus apodemi]
MILLKHNGQFETVSGKLYRIDNHLDAVYLKVSPKQKRLIFTKDIVHLGLNQITSHDFPTSDQLISN